jgi:RNA polymerase sigma-70 factor (ECF subfamily)
MWLGRLLASLLPDEAEALGLLALMLYSQARRWARRDADGAYVPLADQDPNLWDTNMIEEAETLLLHASRMGAAGRYQLEAAVQSAHAVRRLTGRSDWAAIEGLYKALFAVTRSPVVAINLAVALGEMRGPAAGLAALKSLKTDTRLVDYQPYWAALADLSARTGDIDGADEAYQRAIGLESDAAVRCFLQKRRMVLRRP